MPRFQRRHYVAIVALLAEFRHSDLFSEGYTRDVVVMFCDQFQVDNPAFDRQRFLSACGLAETIHNAKSSKAVTPC